MPSPTCTVNAFSTANGVDVADLSLFTIALADATGVTNWLIECIGTSDNVDAGDINADLEVNQTTKTATFPAGIPAGTTLIFRSQVNNGRDINGTLQPSYTTKFGVYCPTSVGFRVIAVNETTEGSTHFGWVKSINAVIRAMP